MDFKEFLNEEEYLNDLRLSDGEWNMIHKSLQDYMTDASKVNGKKYNVLSKIVDKIRKR